jgi:hypothetical protein
MVVEMAQVDSPSPNLNHRLRFVTASHEEYLQGLASLKIGERGWKI